MSELTEYEMSAVTAYRQRIGERDAARNMRNHAVDELQQRQTALDNAQTAMNNAEDALLTAVRNMNRTPAGGEPTNG